MRRCASVIAVLFLCSLLTPIATASIYFKPVVENRIVFASPSGTSGSNAGTILATTYSTQYSTPASGPATGQWYTFCVESYTAVEFYTPGTTYKVGSVSQNLTGTHTSDYTTVAIGNKVTDAAKWLYTQFARELVNGNSLLDNVGIHSYSNAVAADRTDLQNAIWSLVQKADGVNYLNYTSNAQVLAWRNAAIAAAGLGFGQWSGAKYVGIVNPYDNIQNVVNDSQRDVQSFLYIVPEPAAIAAWSVLGLIGVGLIRRTRRGK